VLEAVFILLEPLSPSRRIFIGSHSLPSLWFAVLVLQKCYNGNRALADLSVIMCFYHQTFPSPVTRGANPVAMLASANKHSWYRRRVCILSSEAKERQQAFLVPLSGKQ
jgi:hypothetical protein